MNAGLMFFCVLVNLLFITIGGVTNMLGGSWSPGVILANALAAAFCATVAYLGRES